MKNIHQTDEQIKEMNIDQIQLQFQKWKEYVYSNFIF
jgi:hypothetical protein